MSSASTPSTPWDAARHSARRARADLLAPSGDADSLAPAAQLISRGLAEGNLRLTLLPPADPLLSGAHAVLDPEAATVWVRADAGDAQRAVYVAHELAHFYLHEGGIERRHCCEEPDFAEMDGITASVGYGPRQRRETEANVWAREFLLPCRAAARAFYEEGLEARAIAERVGVPAGVVFGQLGEGLALPFSRDLTPLPPLRSGEGESGKVEHLPLTETLPDIRLPLAGTERGQGGEVSGKVVFPLDPSQSAAAYATTGPLLVGAGPGTGKTRTLTERVLFLTRDCGVPPENLLALTFSRKAADEMRVRITQQDASVGRRAAISTFHAYGRDLLRRHGAAAGLPPNPILLDAVDACALLEREASSLGLTALRYLHDPAYPLPDILRTIGRAKEDLIAPEEFERRARAHGDEKLVDVARVYHVYEKLLRDKGALDFADLICRALRLLTDDPLVRVAEQAQWQHVLVDEYQDVNRAGALLVAALSGRDENVGLWAVGDLRQAIYRFRGASPSNVTRFGTDFPNGRRTELTVNYRSQPALVRLFGEASGDGPAMWQASRPQTTMPSAVLAVADDDQAQADGITRKMREFHEAGIPFSDQIALCRTRGQVRALRGALGERGIPVAAGADEKNLLASADARALLSLVARACEPSGPARYRWETLPPALYAVRARPNGCDAYDLMTEALWGAPGLARTLRDHPAIAALLGLARSFRDRAALLRDEGEDAATAFLAHLRRMVRLGASLTGDRGEEDSADAVRVLTVHASKGLEFPVVFVPNLSAGKFPVRPMPSLIPPLPEDEDAADSDSAFAEEERLFFVALTRARDYLILSRAQKYGRMSAQSSPLLGKVASAGEWRREFWESGPLPPSPSPRFAGGEGESWNYAPLALVEAAKAYQTPPRPQRSGERGTGGEGKPSEGSVPASDADLYLRCPRRYYYGRVLDLPEGIRPPYAGFKSAVTAALAEADPGAALEGIWAEKGPDPTHPHTSLYRQAAEEIVAQRGARMPKAAEAAVAEPIELSLEYGTISVRPDAVVAEGTVFESRTFRKPPAPTDTADAAPDRHISLLQAVAAAQGTSAGAVQMRYLQDGSVRPVADKPKQRAKHLQEYDSALKGIRDAEYPPAPNDLGDCPSCPYFFICPD